MWKNVVLKGFWVGEKGFGNKGDFICEVMLFMAYQSSDYCLGIFLDKTESYNSRTIHPKPCNPQPFPSSANKPIPITLSSHFQPTYSPFSALIFSFLFGTNIVHII